MEFEILREQGKFRLDAEDLASRLISNGYVVFVSGRTRQRELAHMISKLVAPDITVVHLETRSPNDCMCVVDVDRFSAREIRQKATEIDFENEAEWLRAIENSSSS